MMSRKNKGDWLETGLQILGEVGIGGLTIQRMTDNIGLTKGSFYHHFSNIQDFKRELIDYWARQYISTAGDLPDSPAERLALLDLVMKEAFVNVTEPEVAIRTWAQLDNRVRKIVAEVDAIRKQFVLNVFLSLKSDEKQASLMADAFSAMLIGCITSIPRVPGERVKELYAEFKRLYGIEVR